LSSFVLVHGACHGAWCWYKVKARLEARGHTVLALDMPGHGIDRMSIEEVTLAHIVARVGETIAAAAEPVVLVGHSYGGIAITQAAEYFTDKIRKLVYVAAVLVPNGVAAAGIDTCDSALTRHTIAPADRKVTQFDHTIVNEALYGECGADDIALARTLLVPEAVAGLMTPVQTSAQGFGRVPRIYIECAKDRAITLTSQRKLQAALPCEQVFTLDSDHSPFFSRPDELSAILADI
jgi:pimeloyl-ACP methyl ester carboxylesterase